MSLLTNFTDTVGITDSKAPQRAYDTLNRGNAQSLTQLVYDVSPSVKMLQDAMAGRYLDTNLNRYEHDNSVAQGRTLKSADDIWNAQDAGSNTEDFLNPFSDQMQTTAVNKMQGSMGSSLQSSGAQRKMADVLTDMGNEMWDRAFEQALGDSRNRMNAAGTSAKMASQYDQMGKNLLDANNQPALDYLNLNNDLAMQGYAGRIALNEAAGNLAGQNKSFF